MKYPEACRKANVYRKKERKRKTENRWKGWWLPEAGSGNED